MDLVHHHVGEAGQPVRVRVNHVAQDLGGHDDDRRIRIEGDVAGEQPDVLLPVAGTQVVVLLVAQRLDGRGVEAGPTTVEGHVDREFADDRLSGSGRCSYEHSPALGDRSGCVELEFIEFEVVFPPELFDQRGVVFCVARSAVSHMCTESIRSLLLTRFRTSVRAGAYAPARCPSRAEVVFRCPRRRSRRS